MIRAALLLVAACGGGSADPPIVAGGTLIALTEGEPPQTFALGRGDLSLEEPPAWATIADGALVLSPHCDAVPGTAGAAREVTLVLRSAAGDRFPIAVELHPSGTGDCEPRVLACLDQPAAAPTCKDGSALGDGTTFADCATTFAPGARFNFDYMKRTPPDDTFSDPAKQDFALLLHLDNPDPTDPDLSFRVTTDAPLKVPVSAGPDAADRCVALANVNRVGVFQLDYSIVRGEDPDSPEVAIGGYQLGWNKGSVTLGGTTRTVDEPYGVELVSCATPTMCQFARLHDVPQQWCIKAAAADPVHVDLLLWVSNPSMPIQVDVCAVPGHVVADCSTQADTSITVTALSRSLPHAIDIPLNAMSSPLPITLDFPPGTIKPADPELTIQVKGTFPATGEPFTDQYREPTRTFIAFGNCL